MLCLTRPAAQGDVTWRYVDAVYIPPPVGDNPITREMILVDSAHRADVAERALKHTQPKDADGVEPPPPSLEGSNDATIFSAANL